MTGRLSGCGGWGWQGAGQPGPASQLWGPNGQRNQGHSGEQLPSLVTRLSVFRLEPLGSHNTGAFILTAEMPARGRKGRRGPPQGVGLTSLNVGPEASLTSSYPHCLPGKQRPREAANPKCVVARGNLDTALTSLGKSCSSQQGTGVCLVLIFLRSWVRSDF